MNTPEIDRLSTFIRLETVAPRIQEPRIAETFSTALQFLRESYPAVMDHGIVTVDDPWRMNVEIAGTDPSLDPVLLVAHYDVVDVAPGTLDEWTHPPFSGAVSRGFVWGRGAIDDKSVLLGMLEAVERILSTSGRPARGIVLAFGGDEEISGTRGAGVSASEFMGQNRRFHCALDEGSVISKDMLSDPPNPIALIGIAEKGHVDVHISAAIEGGHSSMPPDRTALGIVAAALAKAERHPFKPRLLPTLQTMFALIGAHASFPMGMVYRNVGPLWPLVKQMLTGRRETAALVRTTQAVTMAHGSDAPNVLPARASGTINVRILPGETVADVVDHYTAILRNESVQVSILDPDHANDPVAESSVDHPSYQIVADGAKLICEESIPVPFIVVGATDSRWYAQLCDVVLHLVPLELSNADLTRIHGVDERISVEAYAKMIEFYEYFITKECVRD